MEHPLVAVGASTSSLESVLAMFAELPDPTGLTIFIALQQDAIAQHQLADFLAQRHGGLILEATDGAAIHCDCTYILPAGHLMAIEYGRLKLKRDASQTPIDGMFKAVASLMGSRSLAVLMSGWEADGLEGIREIKRVGGKVLVEDPASAKVRHSLRLALSSGCADAALPPAKLARELSKVAASSRQLLQTQDNLRVLTTATERKEAAAKLGAHPEMDSAPTGSRVLIIDDDAEWLRYLETLMTLWGHTAAIVRYGSHPLRSALDFLPEVVILNPQMKGCDGFELLRELRNDPRMKAVRFVAMSRTEAGPSPRDLKAAGFHAYLDSPKRLAELRAFLKAPDSARAPRLRALWLN